MTKEEFTNEYNKIYDQLKSLEQKYKQEFIDKCGIVFDKPMKIVTSYGFSPSEWKGYVRRLDINYCSGEINIKLSPLKKNGEAKNSVVSIGYAAEYISFEKLKDK